MMFNIMGIIDYLINGIELIFSFSQVIHLHYCMFQLLENYVKS
jgi:hypothetical protein